MSVQKEWQTIFDTFQSRLQLYCCGKAHKLPDEHSNENRLWKVEKVYETCNGKYRFESICLCSTLEIALLEAADHLWDDGAAFGDIVNIFAPRIQSLATKVGAVDQLTRMEQQIKMAVCCHDCYMQTDGMQTEKWNSQNTLCKIIVKPSIEFISKKRQFEDDSSASSQ